MLNVGNSLLQLFLEFLYFLSFILVLNSLVANLLLRLKNLFFNWLFILLPLFFKLFEFLVDCSYFLLEDS